MNEVIPTKLLVFYSDRFSWHLDNTLLEDVYCPIYFLVLGCTNFHLIYSADFITKYLFDCFENPNKCNMNLSQNAILSKIYTKIYKLKFQI